MSKRYGLEAALIRGTPVKSTLAERKAALIAITYVYIDQEDWHGVSDAANDLREIAVEERLAGEV